MKRMKGQVSTTFLVSVGVSILLAMVAGFMNQNRTVDAKLEVVNRDVSTEAQRTSKLEEAVTTMKNDIRETRTDIKEILNNLRKK